jgi:MFS family permease
MALPMLLISPVGGVIADRVDRLLLIRTTNVLWIALTVVLATLTWTGKVTYWEILLASFLNATILAFDNPARQSLIPDLVPRSELLTAVSLNSVAFTGASLVGPAIAGLILSVFGSDIYHGSAVVFYCNAISYVAVLLPVVLWVRVPAREHVGPRASIGADLIEGLQFVKTRRPLVLLLSTTAVTSIFGRSFTQLLPVFAKDVLHVGPEGLGLMYSAPGAGTLVSGIGLAGLGHRISRRHLLTTASVSFALSIFAFALSRSFALSLAILFLSGVFSTLVTATITTLLQLQAPGRMRGRVMALQSQAVIGMTPLGSLLSGWLATRIPAPLAVSVTAAVILVFLGYVLLTQPAWRQIDPSDE